MAKHLHFDNKEEDINENGFSEESLDEGSNDEPYFSNPYEDITDEELERLKSERNLRYSEQYVRKDDDSFFNKPVNPKAVIASLVIIFAYFMTAFLLKTFGVISELAMVIMIAPVVVIFVIIYIIYRKKR